MVASLGTVRSRKGEELALSARASSSNAARPAWKPSIAYTFSDVKGALADARTARRLGYRMKSLVDPSHARALNKVFTPSRAEVTKAKRIVAAFEKARARGKDRAKWTAR